MKINLKATYQLSEQDVHALFWNSLCSSSIGYGVVNLDCSKEAYDNARECVKILKAGSAEGYVKGDYYIALEDVWTQVFKAGDLLICETDYDGSVTTKRVADLDLDAHLEEMQFSESWILDEFAKGEDDSNTHDAFLQCLLLGEIIYG